MILLKQLMLYVDNQEKSAAFWTEKLGFVIKEKIDQGGSYYALVLRDERENSTELVLQNKEFVRAMNSHVNLETPSIMLSTTKNIEDLYKDFQQQGITVGELVILPIINKKSFNFSDPEGNYFAIMENE